MARNGPANDAAPNHFGGPRANALLTNETATAKCPTFNRFIDDIFCSDRELIRWVQRALGYAITGSVDEQLLFITYGTGANGKSKLFELIKMLLGDYSRATDFELLLSNQ